MRNWIKKVGQRDHIWTWFISLSLCCVVGDAFLLFATCMDVQQGRLTPSAAALEYAIAGVGILVSPVSAVLAILRRTRLRRQGTAERWQLSPWRVSAGAVAAWLSPIRLGTSEMLTRALTALPHFAELAPEAKWRIAANLIVVVISLAVVFIIPMPLYYVRNTQANLPDSVGGGLPDSRREPIVLDRPQ